MRNFRKDTNCPQTLPMLKKIHSETNRGECGMRGSILFFWEPVHCDINSGQEKIGGKNSGEAGFWRRN
jgi:hypothetical protein